MLLTVYIGIGLVDAFNGGKDYFKNWQILLWICLPLYFLGSWAIDKNKKMEGKK